MFLYDEMYPSSFKGARYWFKRSTTTAGRKTVVHEYPQKDFRFVEDLGKNLRMFEITGVIKGALYLVDKKNLEKALTTPGIGTLIHPFYGAVRVNALDYEVTEEDTSIGQAVFIMRFAEANENYSPRVTDNNTSVIANLYRKLYDDANEAINLEYTLRFIENLEDAVQVAQRALQRMEALAKIMQSFDSGSSDFNKSANDFDRNKYATLQSASKFGDSFTGLISNFDNQTVDEPSRFSANKRAFGLGSDDDIIKPLTGKMEEEEKNRRLTNGVFNFLILNNMYSSATLLDYDNDVQLDNTQNTLDENYRILLSTDSFLLTNKMVNSITAIRSKARLFFDTLRLTVSKVTTINVLVPLPVSVISYNYYGNTDNYNEIIGLNGITNPASVSGEIRILEK